MNKKEALVWVIIIILVAGIGILVFRGKALSGSPEQIPSPAEQLSPRAVESPDGQNGGGQLSEEPPKASLGETGQSAVAQKQAGSGIPPVTISIEVRKFIPDEVTIEPGTQVTWINNDRVPHTMVEYHRKFYGPRMQPGDSFSVVFTEPGVYTYFSANFPKWGKGKIVVGSPDNEITGNVVADLAREENDSKFALLTLLFVVLVYTVCVVVHRKRRY